MFIYLVVTTYIRCDTTQICLKMDEDRLLWSHWWDNPSSIKHVTSVLFLCHHHTENVMHVCWHSKHIQHVCINFSQMPILNKFNGDLTCTKLRHFSILFVYSMWTLQILPKLPNQTQPTIIFLLWYGILHNFQ